MDGLDHAHRGLLYRHRGHAGRHDGLGSHLADSRAKGFLPISTTRGDRFFIGLLSAAYIHLVVVGFTRSASGWRWAHRCSGC